MTAGASAGGAGGVRTAWLALALGVALVALYDRALAPTRYPYAADSASYIEMATTLRADGHPRVTPWDAEPGVPDAIPQRLFPPGFAVLVAAFVPLAGDARGAALAPPRIAAALLPLLFVLAWRGTAPAPLLLAAALWVLASPGVRGWQYMAYSDVPALALALLALGLVAQGLAAAAAGRSTRPALWLAAGFVAGLGYTVRNSGIAVLAAALGALGYGWLRGDVRRTAVLAWALGALPPLAALAGYNIATFGRLQPYTMPASERAWPLNVGDFARAQLADLGVPFAERAPPAVAVVAIALVFAVLLAAWLRCRADRPTHLRLTLLGGYALGGALLLVVSRSRYEWGNLIDERNVLQYTFALALALVVAGGVLLAPRAQAACRGAALALLCLLLAGVVREAVALHGRPAELWRSLAASRAVRDAVADLPPDRMIGSNFSVLFRIETGRAVRQVDVSGSDADLAGSLAAFRRHAGGRRAVFVLVCDGEWTRNFSACRVPPPSGEPLCERVAARPAIIARCTLPDGAPAS
jgi:hypothetical protein